MLKRGRFLRKRAGLGLVVMAALSAITAPNGAFAAGPGTHVMYINGISTIQTGAGQAMCEYEWADKDPAAPGTQPDRDAVGIPRPKNVPPTCRDTNPGAAGIQPKACSLVRNLGPFPPHDRAADPVQGEVGLNPPCAGNLSAVDLPGPTGCINSSAGTADCGLSAPTFFYGYCGQTYGGIDSGSLKLAPNNTWNIEVLGFPRGRGAWEFNGRIGKSGSQDGYVRLYLAAIPDKLQTEAAACDLTANISSVEYFGTIIVSDTPLERAVGPQAAVPSGHWNYCDATPAAQDATAKKLYACTSTA